VAFHRLGLLAFIEALIFISILVVALAYAWRKGALEWN
jgi:NAD(P)H-quinone oxidoreductase subunit 3